MSAAALMLGGSPFGALGARVANGQAPSQTTGYGPLVPKGDLRLPPDFNYQIIDRQAIPMRDGRPTPGIFDAMGAFPDAGGPQNSTAETTTGETTTGDTNLPGRRTVLIRNHENRERPGEIKVVTGPGLEYDETAFGGNTKLVVQRERTGQRDERGNDLYTYTVVDRFAILGGTSTNCAGGELPFKKWITCEEVVKRQPNGKKHGYNFEVDAMADGPVPAIPIPQMGRFVHEATTWRAGILYQTEDRSLQPDPILGTIGACFYRYIPDERVGQGGNFAETTGPLEALAVKGQPHMNMDAVATPGATFPV